MSELIIRFLLFFLEGTESIVCQPGLNTSPKISLFRRYMTLDFGAQRRRKNTHFSTHGLKNQRASESMKPMSEFHRLSSASPRMKSLLKMYFPESKTLVTTPFS